MFIPGLPKLKSWLSGYFKILHGKIIFMQKGKIVIANWKMNLSIAESIVLAQRMKEKFSGFPANSLVVCPDFVSIYEVAQILKDTIVAIGAQDVFWEKKGAYTGEISTDILSEAGCKYVIIGHSERRRYVLENYEMIHKKIKAVLSSESQVPIVCLGENWEERKTDRRDFVLFDQIQQALTGITPKGGQNIILAYEPIWAIGSGTSIEPAEAEYAHKVIKMTLDDMYGDKIVNDNFQIIYGGSINAENVSGFVNLENIDGLLVGGASLDTDVFYQVAQAIFHN
jgi:triosephosphate isomerase